MTLVEGVAVFVAVYVLVIAAVWLVAWRGRYT